jgi:hypothetical protein
MGPFLLLSTALAAPGGVTELWVKLDKASDQTTLYTLPLGFAEGRDGRWVRMDAEPEGLAALESSGLQWRPAERSLMPPSAYHSPDEMRAALEELAEARPDRARLVDLGWSVEGRQVVALRISNTDAPSRQWRIAGAHHGDETAGAEISLAIAALLVGTEDAALDALLWSSAIWVIPHISPDSVSYLSRYNANSVDLNRNYAYEWSSTEFRPGPHPFSEPETRNLRALSAWQPFGAGLSLHAGATNLGWVWNFTTEPSPDALTAEALATAYEDACGQPGFYITNGAEWYITHGDTTDWAYGRHGTLDYTLEVSHDKNPNSSRMAQAIEDHTPAILEVLAWPWWVQGQVVDETTGRGIPARVRIGESGWPLQAGPEGRFSHPTSEGMLTLMVSAPGYTEATVTADPTESTPLHVALSPSHTILLRPDPAALARGGDGRFSLDVDTVSLTLVRPGEAPVTASPVDGEWVVDLDGLAPGPWSLVTDAGVAHRSLFIGPLDHAVRVDHVAQIDAKRWVLTGEGFGRGTQVWGIWGTDRATTPIRVLESTEDVLVIEHEDLALALPPVDLVLLSNGRQLSILDITPGAAGDTAEPRDSGQEPIDTASSPDSGGQPEADGVGDEHRGKLTSCACTTGSAYPALWLLVSLLPWTRRRRLP